MSLAGSGEGLVLLTVLFGRLYQTKTAESHFTGLSLNMRERTAPLLGTLKISLDLSQLPPLALPSAGSTGS